MMKWLTIVLVAALASSCSNGTSRHLARTKRQIAAVGATNIVADAFALMAAYEIPDHGQRPFVTFHGLTNSLAGFSSMADVKPTMVSVTNRWTGAHRAGIIIVRDESDRFLNSNTCAKIADNIFHFAY